MIERRELVRLASLCARVAPRKPQEPRMGAALLEASGGRLRLSATDQLSAIRVSAEAAVSCDGACGVPAHRLAEIASMAPDGPIGLRLTGKRLEVQAGRARTSVPVWASGEAPWSPEAVDPCLTARAPVEALAALLTAAAALPVADVERWGLNGVQFERCGEALCVRGTDGHRLAHTGMVAEAIEGDTPSDVLGSVDSLSLMARALTGCHGDATLTIGRASLSVEAGGVWLWSRAVEGEAPNARAIVPTDHTVEITCQPAELAEAVRRAMRVRESVDLCVGGALEVVAMSPIGEHRETVPADLAFKHATMMRVRGAYLIDALAPLAGLAVIRQAGALSPVTVTAGSAPSLDGAEYTAIVMPMRPD